MKHTMHTVMQAVLKARVEGDRPLPVLTSNQCHALAQELNKELSASIGRDERADFLEHVRKDGGLIEWALGWNGERFEYPPIQSRWEAWQARAALEQPK